MQAQIQEALSQQTIINPQTSSRAPMAATYVGSFNTSDGPDWTTNPPALSAVQAAAFIFGGSPSDYVISTDPNTTDPLTITHTAWATTWGVSGCQEVAEDYFLDLGAPGYNDPGGTSTAISAYVTDNCTFGNTNYVWLASQSPSIFCPGNFNVSNDLGICGAIVNYTVTATDDEDGVLTPIQTAGLPSGSTFPIGTTTNTFEVTDSDNNTVTCSFDVTVNDNEAPVITCASDIVQNNDLGLCGAVITYNFPTATDNCSALGSDSATFSFTGSVQQFTVPAGVTEIRAAVYGAQGGANWVDNINYGGLVEADIPVIPGQILYIYVGEQPIGINGGWNGGGNGEFAGIGGGGASDIRVDGNALTDRIIVAGAGGGAGYWSGQHIVGGLGGGLIGGAGYRDTPANAGGDPGTQTSSGNGTCGSFNNPIVAGGLGYGGAPDNCGCEGYGGGSGYYGGAGSGNCRGGGGGSSYTDPTLTNVLHSQGVRPGNGEITITWVATLEVIQTAGLTSGSTFPVGTTTNTFVATDAAGNTSTCSFDITINDTEAPVITCVPDATRDTDTGVCQYTVVGTEFDATFTDNCTSGTITNDYNASATLAGAVLPKGVTTIVWTANDGHGQTATCTTVITVEDNEAPAISCEPNATRDTDSGVCEYTIVGTELDATFTDNCAEGSITNDFNGTATLAGETLPTGNTTVVWTVNDGNGQTATCTSVITIEDNEAPIIACPADITANTSAGDCFATVSFTMPYTQDNCGIDTVVQTMGAPSGSQFPVGITTIEFTATDVNGNVSTCSFTITVIDNEAPVAVCQNITIQLDEFGDASITAAEVDGGSTDQCGVASISIDMDTFDCSNVGDNNVTLTVTDVNGNTSTCIAIVTVEDVTGPVVACQNITVELDPITGTVTIAGTDIDNGSTDACGIGSYDLDIDTFDCSNIGDNTVVLTVTDVNGNTETCTAIVTVEDNTNPVLVCQDFTLELGADGTATLDPSDVIASNDDACGIFTVAVDITEFSCADIGTPVTVQVFSQDNNGNLATCMATVTVVDLLAPVVTCPADQTVDPGAGNLFYIVPDYFATGEATAIDNCTDPVTITTQDPAVGTPLSDGVYTITLTATDEYGNVGTCEFELTVATVLGAGNNNQNLGSIAMYPNPAKSEVTIGNPQNLDLERADIYDLTGRLVQSFNLKGMATAKTLNVDNLAAATYVVIINGKEGQITKRLLKE